MAYTVHQLAVLAGITTRTLHHYDEIGLLKPAYVTANGYRHYEERELLQLQQIMFFRELEFPLEDIKKIIKNPDFDMNATLLNHRDLIEDKRKRLSILLKTIDSTLKKIAKEKTMNDKDLYKGFEKEAKERWGHTSAYKQSVGKYEKLTDKEKEAMKKAGEDLLKEMVTCMPHGPRSKEAQTIIEKHFNALRFFYEPTLELYRGLGNLYVDDTRFTGYYEKFHPGLAIFMRDAMHAYCDARE